MFYAGDKEHEQEVRLAVEHDSASHETIYIHTRCWNDWQQRRRGDEEYEAGYAHGMRDAQTRGMTDAANTDWITD